MIARCSARASEMAATVARSVAGPCRKRQLRPVASPYSYPVTRVNDGLTHTSGLSGWRGSVMVKAMSVATTARSRSACR